MSETGSKQHLRRIETRRKLLASALSIFGQRGFDAATVDEIAIHAGYSKGAFYFHFPSKEDIFIELLRSYVVGSREEPSEADIPEEDTQHRRRELAPLVLEFWAHAPRNERIRDGLRGLYEARMEDILDSFVPLGMHSDQARALGQTITALEDGALLHEVLGITSGQIDRRELVQRLASPEAAANRSAKSNVPLTLVREPSRKLA